MKLAVLSALAELDLSSEDNRIAGLYEYTTDHIDAFIAAVASLPEVGKWWTDPEIYRAQIVRAMELFQFAGAEAKSLLARMFRTDADVRVISQAPLPSREAPVVRHPSREPQAPAASHAHAGASRFSSSGEQPLVIFGSGDSALCLYGSDLSQAV